MCWSTGADLATGTAITSASLIGLALVRHPRQVLFAFGATLLGFHQLVEADVWHHVHDNVAHGTAVTIWAFMAYILVPVYVPISVFAISRGRARRWLWPFIIVGIITALFLGHDLATQHLVAKKHDHVLDYGLSIHYFIWVAATYHIAVCGSCIFSGRRHIRTLGLILAVSSPIIALIDYGAQASVWCSIGALASVQVSRQLHAEWRQERLARRIRDAGEAGAVQTFTRPATAPARS